MATGGENSAKSKGSSISTRPATSKGKPIDYKQMASGNYRQHARLDEYEYDLHQSDSQSDTGLYDGPQGASLARPEVDPFMGTGNPREKKKLSLPREDLDYELAVEVEELTVLHRQLEAARKEEELLKKRGEADNLRRRIA